MNRILPFLTPQPVPVETLASVITVDAVAVTAIYRRWAPGDVPRCRLCPAGRCTADRSESGDECLVTVSRAIAGEDLDLFSTRHCTFND